jgi:aconitate hydratase
VGGGDDDAAAGEVGAHQFGEALLARGVERGGRLVEQPDRSRGGEQAGDGKAAALAGREVGGRETGEGVEADARQGGVHAGSAASSGQCGGRIATAEKRIPEGEVFSDREGGLQAVAVTQVMGLRGKRRLGRPAGELQVPLRELQEAGDEPQQRGFSRTVAARDRQRLPGGDGKANACKDFPSPADTAEVARHELHQTDPARVPRGGTRVVCSGGVRAMFTTRGRRIFMWQNPGKALISARINRLGEHAQLTARGNESSLSVAPYQSNPVASPAGMEPKIMTSLDSFKCARQLKVGSKTYTYYSLPAAEKNGLKGISRLPFSLKVLLENLLRNEDGRSVTKDDLLAFSNWLKTKTSEREVAFRPARVLMQDFTGVPAVVDLAAMRDAMEHLGGNAKKINPLVPVDLVIDHSVAVNYFGHSDSFKKNVEDEYKQNQERYRFLKWAQQSFENFRVVPPGTGICHQVNLEYLSQTVWIGKGTAKIDGKEVTGEIAYPDTLVGTDSHTTMVNGLSVLGWGVGGIEAEAAMLGQPYSMVLPEVIGVKLSGKLKEGMTATDLVLTVTQMLRKRGVVGKFVEYFGPGVADLSIADRATLGNMAPEYGATCGFFAIDEDTLKYLRETGRAESRVALVAAYAKAQGMYRTKSTQDPVFTDVLKLELGSIEPSLAGPKRPQDRVALKEVKIGFTHSMDKEFGKAAEMDKRVPVEGKDFTLGNGDVVIAAITSCTNTSNPSVMIAAGLVARKAVEKGLKVKPWVKTSLAPGSQVVAEYYEKSGLQKSLDALGFNLVGFGCTTCIGNSGPLPEEISEAINKNDLVAAAVLSGNRNFEGRVNADVRANYLASPPLVVAYAIAGSMQIDVAKAPLGVDKNGKKVYLRDIWPTNREIATVINKTITKQLFTKKYGDVFKGDANWRKIAVKGGLTFKWDDRSTYVQNPPYFEGMQKRTTPIEDIVDARILGLFLDSITTDHISPAGSIKEASPAGEYLRDHQVRPRDFNQYGTRRGNHQVMMRGTFGNIRIKNQMVPGVEGGVTIHYPSRQRMTIYDAAMKYKADGVPLVVFAGKEYGTGSSRDWAAKGAALLGIRAVVCQSFERIHRSNLIGMGVVPLCFEEGASWQQLGLKGSEQVTIRGLHGELKPRQRLIAEIVAADGKLSRVPLISRIDTLDELEYFKNGGILQYVLRHLAA